MNLPIYAALTLLHVTDTGAKVTCNKDWSMLMTGRSDSTDRVAKHRRSLRAAGLRPIQIWLPDTRRRGFAAECRRQSLSLRRDPLERRTLESIEKLSDLRDWR